ARRPGLAAGSGGPSQFGHDDRARRTGESAVGTAFAGEEFARGRSHVVLRGEAAVAGVDPTRGDAVVLHHVADAERVARRVPRFDVASDERVDDQVVFDDVVIRGDPSVAAKDDPLAVFRDHVAAHHGARRVWVQLDAAVGVAVDEVAHDVGPGGVNHIYSVIVVGGRERSTVVDVVFGDHGRSRGAPRGAADREAD